MGRRALKLTISQMGEVETLAAVLTADQVADYFGIGRTTFFNMIARDPEIAERYKKGKARAIGSIAQGLIQKARAGDTASMIFYLKTQGGWRERGEFDPNLPGEETGLPPIQIVRRIVEVVDRVVEPPLPQPVPWYDAPEDEAR